MIGVEIELSPAFEKQAELLGQYDAISNRHLTDALDASVKAVQGDAKSSAPVFRSHLRKSIETEVKTIGANIEGRVFSTIQEPYPYPLVMEYGRRPGKMPPPSALVRWVHLVMKIPTKEASGVAFVVARSIGRKGIKGRKFLTNSIVSNRPRIASNVEKAVELTNQDMGV